VDLAGRPQTWNMAFLPSFAWNISGLYEKEVERIIGVDERDPETCP
jgi:hypothetical protein